jgi:predicted CXXCH cytochrome family protein
VKRLSFKTASILAIAAIAISAFVISCATTDRVVVAPPMIPGAKYVGMDTCATCHEKEVKNFKMAAHSRITIGGDAERVQGQGCEACHGPGSLHVDAGGGRGKFIINPKKNPEACFACHLDKNASFSLPNRHPVKEGRMSCTDCHDPHGENIMKPKGMSVARVNDVCAKCHREQTRPFVYEHMALREGCTTCHSVHGSINDKMLIERNQNLCLKCHSNDAFSEEHASGDYSRGACWSGGCHTSIHGSNMHPRFRY